MPLASYNTFDDPTSPSYDDHGDNDDDDDVIMDEDDVVMDDDDVIMDEVIKKMMMMMLSRMKWEERLHWDDYWTASVVIAARSLWSGREGRGF